MLFKVLCVNNLVFKVVLLGEGRIFRSLGFRRFNRFLGYWKYEFLCDFLNFYRVMVNEGKFGFFFLFWFKMYLFICCDIYIFFIDVCLRNNVVKSWYLLE